MEKIGIIINPHAKQNKKTKINPVELYKQIGGDRVVVRATKNLDEVSSTAKEFKKNKISYLGICGGDGTIHHVISRFLNVYKKTPIPPVLILKGGTMNTISRSINLKGKGPKILERALKAINDNKELQLSLSDTMKIGDKVCFLFGIGMTANFLNEYYKAGGAGPVSAVKVIIKAVLGAVFGKETGNLFDRINVKVKIDNKELESQDFLAILAGTVKDIGMGFKTLFRAREKGKTFHIISVASRPIDLVMQIHKLKLGKPLAKNYQETLAKKLKLMSNEKFQYTMDGDMYEEKKQLSLEIGPQVRLINI